LRRTGIDCRFRRAVCGIGRQLAEYALKNFPGIHSIEALVGNEPAKCLYENMGFEAVRIVSGKMPGNESFSVKVYLFERTARAGLSIHVRIYFPHRSFGSTMFICKNPGILAYARVLNCSNGFTV